MNIRELLLSANPVLPVLAISRLEDGIPLAEALFNSGLKVIEVTLRTESALEIIRELKKSLPQVKVGAGTVTNVAQLKELEQMGADFAVSPGSTPALLEAGKLVNLPFLPAISSVSEIMVGMDFGYETFKFFPAQASGGVSALKAFSGPFPNIKFCPTGGISENNYQDYLNLKNVLCIGGTWVAPADAIANQQWQRIEQICSTLTAQKKGQSGS